MGEKKSKKNEGGEKKKSGELQKNEGGGGGKNDGNLTVVLKSDFHCDGCVSKVVKAIRSFEGVEKVQCDADSNKLTVIGKVDPVMLREKVEQKTHKHVELVSPVPKKDGKGKDGGGGGAAEEKKKQNKENKDPKENKGGGEDNKKSKEKEPPITTAVLKVHLHCQGCIQKIYKIVTKFKGYKEMKIDKQKDLVTVTGSMDVKDLAETLKKHLKKEVEIVPAKKEGGEKKEKGGDNGGGGGEKGKGAGKGKRGGGEGKGKGEEGGGIGGGEMIIGNVGNGMQIMQQMQQPVQFAYPYPYMYGPVYPADQFQNPYPVSVHAPQLFSDENPNACSVM
ncbi:PREDICTED: heavy metal-associated isoprenylated plant protein 3-like [Nicotiana attenuata]|uniref:heavy metal-associated isoprenylated plant protein 3-like n=1 Tax=Nicotiana attenuata TaxID=49451 RepID=UPI0009049762|nr:PREDICTED: heavy metal-associated isoprenylated plant protein 3-like [Nicotiana attenuata]